GKSLHCLVSNALLFRYSLRAIDISVVFTLPLLRQPLGWSFFRTKHAAVNVLSINSSIHSLNSYQPLGYDMLISKISWITPNCHYDSF
ncbi:MAG: hypothetical protein ACRCX6_01145, partial [Plesiomonas shigelloides]